MTKKGKCGDGEAKEIFLLSHTPLSQTSVQRGNVVTKKGSNDEGRMTNEEGRDRQMTKEQ